MRFIVILGILLWVSPLMAGQVEWNGQIIQYSDRYSFQDLTNAAPLLIPSGTTVYQTVFMPQEPDTVIFDPAMAGVTFIECSMNNTIIPSGNFVKNVYRPAPIRFRHQNDRRYWEIDAENKPVHVISREVWLELGFSTSPADIPTRMIPPDQEPPRKRP